MAGKGDSPRAVDRDKYKAGYVRAFGKRKQMRSGTYVWRKGKLVPVKPGEVHVDDTPRASVGMGVGIDQVPEMNRRDADLGVKYHPETGDAMFSGSPGQVRQQRLKLQRRVGLIDRDEIRG